jgi:GNAT superfamily N-acetyltransferase
MVPGAHGGTVPRVGENLNRGVITEDTWLAGVLDRPVFRVDAACVGPHGGAAGAIVGAVRAHASDQAAALYYAKVDTADVARAGELTGVGFAVVDVNVTLDRVAGPVPVSPASVRVADVAANQHAAVLEIAGHAFRLSRFHLDPLIPRALADRVKREWVGSYVAGRRGERLLVATIDDRPVGFLAVLAADIDGKVARVIDLVAVAPEAQGLGVGTALVRSFIHLTEATSDRLRVGTQIANARSLRLYTRAGFEIVHSAYVMHLHVGPRFEEGRA